jgi:PPK2 family polyphosphate:nucleotide phosphotransferase
METTMKYIERFRVLPGSKVKLMEIDTGFTAHHESHKDAAEETEKDREKLRALQGLLYSDGRCSVLICLQGMDTAGKDGTIGHILGAMNPQGCRVAQFRQPSTLEQGHDFLWRVHKVAPARREVTIFNRSHYEDVLVVRVHKLVPEKTWSKRYDEINAFEETLVDGGTHILKFYLHISKKEQLTRFEERLDDPAKRWKISEADYSERKLWPDYEKAYEEALSRCSTRHAPWFVIPSDHKWFRNLAVARIVVEHMEGLGLKLPKPSVDLERIRRQYHAAQRA